MKKLSAFLLYAAFVLRLSAASQAPVSLGAAANFAVLAGSTVTNTGASQVTGDVGVSPGTAVAGLTAAMVNGTIHTGDPAAAQAIADLTTAFNDAAGRSVGPVTVAGNLGGQTLTPGLYKSTSSLAISSGDLTLDAQGDANAVFIFQMASTLTTTSGRQVILAGGAQAANIFWQVGSSATLGTNSVFKGTIMALQSISLTTGATLDGRALAEIAAVTLQSNVITKPVTSSSGPQPTLVSNSVRSVANGAIPNPPGSLVYVQGTNLASATTKIVASSTPLLTHLQNSVDNVSATVNGTLVPMYYVLPNYVAFQLPWNTSLSTGTATLVVTRNGVASTPLPFSVSQFSPGIYTTSGNGIGMAWAIFAAPSKINPTGQVAQAANVGSYVGVAATEGDVLYIYAGGLGPPKDAGKMTDGRAPCPLQNSVPGPCPASYKPSDYATNTTPVVMVGGVQATGITSILDPTYPGLYLVFFTIPTTAPKGNAVPIQLQIPGGPSTDAANVTIAIQ
jgi:uncharacterized protein (TIGR03437 family)